MLAELLQLDFKLYHNKGEHNLADFFSRPSSTDRAINVIEEWSPEEIAMYTVQATTAPLADDTWVAARREDTRTAAIMHSISEPDGNSDYLGKEYTIEIDLLHFIDPLQRKRLFVPVGKEVHALAHFHDSTILQQSGCWTPWPRPSTSAK